MNESPRFDEIREDWEFRPTTELHSTANKALYDFSVDVRPEGSIAVLAGAAFNLWSPDFADRPYAYSNAATLRTFLSEKLARSHKAPSSVFTGMRFEDGLLPLDKARVAFRDIARATDTRTSIACLVPPGVALTEMAPYLVRRQGGADAEAFLLAVMSSIPFDWTVRRWVELHFKFNVLNSLPIPLYSAQDRLGARASILGGRLAAVDDRYAVWAEEVGVQVGTVTDDGEKADVIAELDALVSLLYGLSTAQVEHVFATFHRGWDYRGRLDAVLTHYNNWKSAS